MKFKRYAVMFIATGGYSGYIPKAPGTFGTLVGLFLYIVLTRLGPSAVWIATFLMVAVAVWIADMAESMVNLKDPGFIVIDEVAGVWITFLGIPLTLATGVAGFILFRLLDIIKPPPIRQLERQFKGGLGIVIDDVAAGVLANLILRALLVLAN